MAVIRASRADSAGREVEIGGRIERPDAPRQSSDASGFERE
jgi:hypothetical protein